MDCSEIRHQLAAHIDGELDPARDTEVKTHLQACATCAAAARQQAVLRQLVREKLPRYAPSPYLATRIRAQLQDEKNPSSPRPFQWPGWRLAGALVALSLGLFAAYEWNGRHAGAAQLSEQIVSTHLQALKADHLTDIASSDRHAVGPWLARKLDFSPPVADLAKAGYPLLGARVERIGTQTVAALVYQKEKHYITLFVWPAKAALPFHEAERQGCSVCAWRRADWNLVAVSDMSDDAVDAFADRVNTAID